MQKYGGIIDVVLCNTGKGSASLVKKYATQNQFPVVIDEAELEKLGVQVVAEDIMSAPELIRHDSKKLAKVLLKIAR